MGPESVCCCQCFVGDRSSLRENKDCRATAGVCLGASAPAAFAALQVKVLSGFPSRWPCGLQPVEQASKHWPRSERCGLCSPSSPDSRTDILASQIRIQDDPCSLLFQPFLFSFFSLDQVFLCSSGPSFCCCLKQNLFV